MQIQIKNLTEISKSQWQPLWELYLEFYKSQVADAVTERTWQRLHAAECEHMYGFAAVIEHQVVGIVHVIEHESCWTLQPYAYLQDLYTLEEYRGQGIGKALIAKVKEYCVSGSVTVCIGLRIRTMKLRKSCMIKSREKPDLSNTAVINSM